MSVASDLLRFAKNETLASADAKLREQLKAAEASPFLGQHDLPPRVAAIVQGNLIDPHPVDVFESLFSVVPAVTVAFLAGLAQREAGKDGEGEFYRHLEEELDHKLSPPERSRLHTAFRTACITLGLPILARAEQEAASSWFRIAEYALQAGPLTTSLRALAAAAVQLERDLGPPDPFDPDGAAFWQEAMVDLLEARGRRQLARVLREDRLAWHACAYGRLAAGSRPSTSFESRFLAAIEAARLDERVERARFGPPTTLLFADDEILLQTPQHAPGWLWSARGSWAGEVVLRPGEELPISCEDQVTLVASRDPPEDGAASQQRVIALWQNARLAVFDLRSGRRTPSVAPAGRLCLLAREPFSVAAQAARQLVSHLWGVNVELADGQSVRAVFADGGSVEVVGRTEPRLDWSSPGVTELDAKPTFGSLPLSLTLTLSEEARAGWGDQLEVVLRTPTRELSRASVALLSPGEGFVEFNYIQLGRRFERLMAALVRKGEDRPLVLAPSAWLWPGLRRFEPGLLEGDVPENFNLAASAGVQAGALGIAVTTEAQRWADIAFNRDEGRPFRFRLKRPGLFLELEDGADRRPFAAGSSVVDDGAPRFLRIHCDDPEAAIALPHQFIPRAFGPGGLRRVRLDGLGDSGEGEVSLHPGGDASRALSLVSVARPCTPLHARALRQGGRPCLEFELAEPIGVFEFAGLELLSGEALALRTGDGLNADFQSGRWRVTPDVRSLPDGVWIFEVRAVLQGHSQPRPLRMPRGDRFALLMIIEGARPATYADAMFAIHAGMEGGAVFTRLNELLAVCWAECCWAEGVEHLASFWMRLGSGLACAASTGDETAQDLLVAASGVAPPPDAAASWVPVRHPIELWPAMFTTGRDRLISLLRDADDEGARTLSALLENPAPDVADRKLRHDEACRKFGLRLERAGRGGMNRDRLSHAAWLCTQASREMRRARRGDHIPAAPQDESDRAALVEAAPAFFFGLTLAGSLEAVAPGAVEGWLKEIKGEDTTLAVALQHVGLLCRLGPELLAWHLAEARRP